MNSFSFECVQKRCAHNNNVSIIKCHRGNERLEYSSFNKGGLSGPETTDLLYETLNDREKLLMVVFSASLFFVKICLSGEVDKRLHNFYQIFEPMMLLLHTNSLCHLAVLLVSLTELRPHA